MAVSGLALQFPLSLGRQHNHEIHRKPIRFSITYLLLNIGRIFKHYKEKLIYANKLVGDFKRTLKPSEEG